MAEQLVVNSPVARVAQTRPLVAGERERLASLLRELAGEMAIARRESRDKQRQIEAHERSLERLSRTVSRLQRANQLLQSENAILRLRAASPRPVSHG